MENMQIDIGKGLTMNVNIANLMKQSDSLEHVLNIGLRNILMDCHAGITKAEYPDDKIRGDVALAIAGKKLQALYENNVRTKIARASQSSFERMLVKALLSMLTLEKRKEIAKHDDKGAAFIKSAIEKNLTKVTDKANAMIEAERIEAEERNKLSGELDLDI